MDIEIFPGTGQVDIWSERDGSVAFLGFEMQNGEILNVAVPGSSLARIGLDAMLVAGTFMPSNVPIPRLTDWEVAGEGGAVQLLLGFGGFKLAVMMTRESASALKHALDLRKGSYSELNTGPGTPQ